MRRWLAFQVRLFVEAFTAFEGWLRRALFWGSTVLLTILGYLAPEWSNAFPELAGLSRVWAVPPVLLAFLIAVMNANYRRFQDLEGRLAVQEGEQAKQAVIDGLADLRRDGVNIYAERLPAEVQLREWKAREQEWRTRVGSYLAEHFTEAVRGRFEAIGPMPSIDFTHSTGPRHRHELSMLAYRLETLGEIINRHSGTFKLPAAPERVSPQAGPLPLKLYVDEQGYLSSEPPQ